MSAAAEHERERRRRMAAQSARWRHQMLDAGSIDPDQLSERGRRILAWLTQWDDWTVGGVADMLTAAYQAGLATTTDHEPAAPEPASSGRDRDSVTARLDAIQHRPSDPEVGL
jgi:hypothetical protein